MNVWKEAQSSANPTQRTGRNIGTAAANLVRRSSSKIKDSALRLFPGLPKPLPLIQRANRASRVDAEGFPGFVGSNGGWARPEYGEYYATSVAEYRRWLF